MVSFGSLDDLMLMYSVFWVVQMLDIGVLIHCFGGLLASNNINHYKFPTPSFHVPGTVEHSMMGVYVGMHLYSCQLVVCSVMRDTQGGATVREKIGLKATR